MSLPPLFVEFVCGPPGGGKSTYCEAKRQLLVASSPDMDPEANADRHLVHVNLDPANDGIFPYPCVIDICDLIELKKVAEEEQLGPNGSYLFAIDYISQHSDWIMNKMIGVASKLASNDRSNDIHLKSASRGSRAAAAAIRPPRPVWFLIDCPGQVEFYVHSTGLAQLVRDFTKKLKCQVCLTHLCDAAVATRDVFSYVSTCLLCLTSMTDIELPQINVLTKWDRAVELAKEKLEMIRSSSSSSSKNETTGNHREVSQEDVEEWLEPFTNASVFSSEHFNRFWYETQMDRTMRAQQSLRNAMMRRCGNRNENDDAQLSESIARDVTCKNNSGSEENRSHDCDDDDDGDDGDEPKKKDLRSLTKTILEVIEGYNLVGYVPLDVQNAELMQQLCLDVDNAVGFAMQTYSGQ